MNNFWTDRRVFVTGATGFVGSNLTRALVEAGAAVVCLQRDDTQPNSLDMLGVRERVTVVSGELEDLGLLTRVLNEYEVEAVFHLAAVVKFFRGRAVRSRREKLTWLNLYRLFCYNFIRCVRQPKKLMKDWTIQ